MLKTNSNLDLGTSLEDFTKRYQPLEENIYRNRRTIIITNNSKDSIRYANGAPLLFPKYNIRYIFFDNKLITITIGTCPAYIDNSIDEENRASLVKFNKNFLKKLK